MDDAVLTALRREIADAVGFDVPLQFPDHLLVLPVGIGAHQAGRWVRMILGGEGSLRVPEREPAVPKALKGERAGYLVNQVETDEDLVVTALHRRDDVAIKDLLEERLTHAHVPFLIGWQFAEHITVPFWSPYWYPNNEPKATCRGGHQSPICYDGSGK